MKRSSSVKKLALSRETLRRLSDQTLREAAGGAISTAVTSCQWSECDTCGIICSTPLASCNCAVE